MKSGFFFSSLFILDIYKLIENELFDLHWCSTLKKIKYALNTLAKSDFDVNYFTL